MIRKMGENENGNLNAGDKLGIMREYGWNDQASIDQGSHNDQGAIREEMKRRETGAGQRKSFV